MSLYSRLIIAIHLLNIPGYAHPWLFWVGPESYDQPR